jgi:hypothetical protein
MTTIEKCEVFVVMENRIDFEIVKIRQNSWLFKLPVLRNYAAITLGNNFFCKGQLSENLFKHESAHIRQKFKEGTVKFYFKYLFEFVRNLIKFRNWKEAYRGISYEIDARAAEGRPIVHFGKV